MTDLIALLQTVALLLGTLQGNPGLPSDVQQNILNLATEAVQVSKERLANQGTITATGQTSGGDTITAAVEVVTPIVNDPLKSYWPNYERLTQSYYTDLNQNQVLPGNIVQPRYEHLSFGDLNNDGRDDAMVIVERIADNGTIIQSLAPMINSGNSLVNIDNLTLGYNVAVYSHRITNGRYKLEASVDGTTFTRYYQLFGDELRQVEN